MTSRLEPPTEVLRRNRITITDLAAACHEAPMEIAAQLSGRLPMAERTLEALRRLAGAQVADELRWTATQARTAFLDQRRSSVRPV
jgi:hypothetical protein